MTPDEANAIVKIRAGNPQGFQWLYNRYAGRVTGFALRLTGSRAEAEDLTQEVFLAAYTGRAGFRGGSQLLTWLLGIAARRWRDRCRRQTPPTTPLPDAEATGVQEFALAGSAESPVETEVVNALTLARAGAIGAALSRGAAPRRVAGADVSRGGGDYGRADWHGEVARFAGDPDNGALAWRGRGRIR